jgi:hypothetical protein
MGEGVRLSENFNVEDHPNQQSNQPQHPQQTNKTENLLKETPTKNNIGYIIKDTKQQTVLDYLLASEQGEINNKKLKIGEKTYNFDRNKPLSKRLITKFNKIKQTIDYKKYELKEKRDIKWVNLDKSKALTGI